MGLKYEKDPAGFRYTSAEDIRIKLNGSWIYYDGEPHFVITGARDDDYLKVSIKTIKDGQWTRNRVIDIRDEKVDQYVFPMGWYNSKVNERPVYVARLPSRMYKQGVHRSALMAEYLSDGGFENLSMYETEINDWLRQEYPNPYKIIRGFENWRKGQGFALSKDVALLKQTDEVRVFIQREDIGKFHPETMSTEVTKPGMYSVIHRYLEEAGIQ